jgi:hypothetical protein
VKPEITRGSRRLLPRRKRTRGVDPNAKARPAGPADDDFDPVEFAEFLEADEGSLPIDPVFQERLREQLWGMVCERAERKPPKRPRGGS